MRRRACLQWIVTTVGIASLAKRSAAAEGDSTAPVEIVAVPLQTAAGAVYNPTVLGPAITSGWTLASRGAMSRLGAAQFLPGLRRVGPDDMTEVLHRGSSFRNAPWYDVAKASEERLRRQDFALVWIDSVGQFARAFEFKEVLPEAAAEPTVSITESMRRSEPWKGTKPLPPARPGTRVPVTRTGELRARRDGVVGFVILCAGIEIQIATRAEVSITLAGPGERAVIAAGLDPR
ncbi:MAG: hypothetical protein JNK85_25195 [Verrucomicrobiales bacterium]|nr:hypothetical protein [Verrucomicrobiales bacterium]